MDTTASLTSSAHSIPPILRTSGLTVAIIFFAKDFRWAGSVYALPLADELYWPIMGFLSVLAFLSARVFLSPGFYALSVSDNPSKADSSKSSTAFRPGEIAAIAFLAASFFPLTITFLNSRVVRIDSGIAAFLSSFILLGYAVSCYKRGLPFVKSWAVGAGVLFLLLPLPLKAFDLMVFHLPTNPIAAWLGVQAFSYPYPCLGTILLASIGGELFAHFEKTAPGVAPSARIETPTAPQPQPSPPPTEVSTTMQSPRVIAKPLSVPEMSNPRQSTPHDTTVAKPKRRGFFDDIS